MTAPSVLHLQGSADELHSRALDVADIEVWRCEVTKPAIVLGSAQRAEVLDVDACARLGVDVVRRRSGGGLVLVEPGAMCWIDIVVPSSSPWWTDDVSVSMIRIGDVWRDALLSLGVPAASLHVHRGGLQRSALGALVCFASLGPGEVTLDDAKLVGLSARRTRHAARYQCLVHRSWNPQLLARLLAPGGPRVDELAAIDVVGLPGGCTGSERVVAAVAEALAVAIDDAALSGG